MAAGEAATVFLETSLGTRLAVSFPAVSTTVADLKRQVSAEHAACFPNSSPIAITSLQVKLDGSWFNLTDSMAARAAFEWINGPWCLRVEAHELRARPVARKDAKCGKDDTEPNAGHPGIAEASLQYMLLPSAASQGGGNLASVDGYRDTPQMNQQDKPHKGDVTECASCQREDERIVPPESPALDSPGDIDTLLPSEEDKTDEFIINHGSGQLEEGITMPQESSDFDLAAGGSDSPPMNKQDKSQEVVEHASGREEDGITMPQESSDFDVEAEEDNGPVCLQQKVIILEPRGKKRLREEDEIDKSIALNCDGSLPTLATSVLNVELSEEKSSGIEQPFLKGDPLPHNLVDPSNGLAKEIPCVQKKPWTSGVGNGEGVNDRSDVSPCVESMKKDNSSDKQVKAHRGDKEGPKIAGPCTGDISCKGTDVPNYVESMKEDDWRPVSNDHYLNKGEYEGATSTASKEHEACFRKQQRVVVRKVPMSRAMKMYSFRC